MIPAQLTYDIFADWLISHLPNKALASLCLEVQEASDASVKLVEANPTWGPYLQELIAEQFGALLIDKLSDKGLVAYSHRVTSDESGIEMWEAWWGSEEDHADGSLTFPTKYSGDTQLDALANWLEHEEKDLREL